MLWCRCHDMVHQSGRILVSQIAFLNRRIITNQLKNGKKHTTPTKLSSCSSDKRHKRCDDHGNEGVELQLYWYLSTAIVYDTLARKISHAFYWVRTPILIKVRILHDENPWNENLLESCDSLVPSYWILKKWKLAPIPWKCTAMHGKSQKYFRQ